MLLGAQSRPLRQVVGLDGGSVLAFFLGGGSGSTWSWPLFVVFCSVHSELEDALGEEECEDTDGEAAEEDDNPPHNRKTTTPRAIVSCMSVASSSPARFIVVAACGATSSSCGGGATTGAETLLSSSFFFLSSAYLSRLLRFLVC